MVSTSNKLKDKIVAVISKRAAAREAPLKIVSLLSEHENNF